MTKEVNRKRSIAIREDPHCDFIDPLRMAARDVRLTPSAYARVLVIQSLLRLGYLEEEDLRV